jgi:hypothetical protein
MFRFLISAPLKAAFANAAFGLDLSTNHTIRRTDRRTIPHGPRRQSIRLALCPN